MQNLNFNNGQKQQILNAFKNFYPVDVFPENAIQAFIEFSAYCDGENFEETLEITKSCLFGMGDSRECLEDFLYDIYGIEKWPDILKNNLDYDGISLDLQAYQDIIVIPPHPSTKRETFGFYFWNPENIM